MHGLQPCNFLAVFLQHSFYLCRHTLPIPCFESHLGGDAVNQITAFGEERKTGDRLVFFLRGVRSFVGYALYHTYLLGIDRTQRVIQKRKAGIGMDAVITLLQVLIYIHVPRSNAGEDGVFLLPHDAVPGIEHLHKQCLASLGKSKALSIHNVCLEPKVFTGFVNPLVRLEIDKFSGFRHGSLLRMASKRMTNQQTQEKEK